MSAPPLGELYDLLRADGFAIGVDDHVRIGRLLAQDAAWTLETLRIAVGALVVTDRDQRGAFDACWERWARSVPTPRAADVVCAFQPPRAADVVRVSPPPPPPRRARWVIAIGGAIAILVALGLAARRCGEEPPIPPPIDAVVAIAPPIATGHVEVGPKARRVDASLDPPRLPPTFPPSPRPPPPSRAAIDLALAGLVIGAILLVCALIAGAARARARRRFLPEPWRYAPAVPPASAPVLPRIAIEDAAADLTWQAPRAGHELDIARSVIATVDRGGLPTVIHRRPVAVSRYIVLEDRAGGAAGWAHIYDELFCGLAREGVELERYTFAANPEDCTGPAGRRVSLDELLDHCDALIVIGDGDGAVDPLTGARATWLASLRHVPRRLWINPVPPARWSAGAHAIAADTPIAHGVARALTALNAGVDRVGRLDAPFPAVIERAPGTASAIAALRTALGDRAFLVVAAVSVTGPPTIDAARWLAETHGLALDEQDWLAVATLPWFRTERWPDGLRDRLGDALAAEASDLSRALAATSDRLLLASEPPRGSGAHLAWQLEGARRAGRRGERRAAGRSLNQIAGTALVDPARGLLATLGLPDRARRALRWAVAVGTTLVVVAAGSGVVATRAWRSAIASRAAERHLEKLAGEGARLPVPTRAPWPEVFAVRVTDGNGDPVPGAHIVWRDPQLGPRSHIERSDADGVSRAPQIYASPLRDDLEQVAQLIAVWNGDVVTEAPVAADGDKVAYRFAQVARGCPGGMVPVQAGTFQMGSPEGVGDPEEHPQHEVTLSGYCIDKTEVTVQAYAACVVDKACPPAPLTVQWSGYSKEDVTLNSQLCNRADRPDHPINCVDWGQAKAYCTWADKRLPTEAEWEYAARGTDRRDYPWGNDPPTEQRLNACGPECVAMAKRVLHADWSAMKTYNATDGWETTAPVGSFPKGASPVGALDMAGNVWEWTADWYGDYQKAPAKNPPGAETGSSRVLRGGGWVNFDAGRVRAANRIRNEASDRSRFIGFRCARGD
jgi:formylglycine-generating enzyme